MNKKRRHCALALALLCAAMPELSMGAALAINPGVYQRNTSKVNQTVASSQSSSSQIGASQTSSSQKGEIKMMVTSHKAPLVEKYLLKGKLKEGEELLIERLNGHTDDQARFGLGVLQFLQAIEGLGQSMTRYGFRTHEGRGLFLPFLQLPANTNTNCEKIDYAKLRQIISTFQLKLLQAEATMAPIEDAQVKLPLHFGMIRLDLNGDGKTSENNDEDTKSLWKLYAKLTRNSNVPAEQAENFFIKFDRGDVHWLRGYCHLISAVCDIYLAYDSKELFEHTAHLFFVRPDTPFEFLDKGRVNHEFGRGHGDIMDAIALVHLIRCNVAEPQRMTSALNHLQAVIDQSRISWKWIMAETDNDHEWLPNPRQTGVIPNAQVTEQMVVAWGEVMNESERVIKGELLIPFWRGDDESRGINLRKVFLEPRPFDLVLWVQGTEALPYLEKGKLTKGDTWNSLRREFGSHFPGFALYFN